MYVCVCVCYVTAEFLFGSEHEDLVLVLHEMVERCSVNPGFFGDFHFIDLVKKWADDQRWSKLLRCNSWLRQRMKSRKPTALELVVASRYQIPQIIDQDWEKWDFIDVRM